MHNELIETARTAALDVLRPTPADLEHGLELHRQFLVMDSYGFAPRAAVDGDVLKAAVEAGAGDRELEDLRSEMSMTRVVTSSVEREECFDAWDQAGVTCIFQNAGEEGQSVKRLLKRLAHFTYTADMLRDHLLRAVTPDDICRAKKDGKHCFYMSGNGVPLAEDWVNMESELWFIRIFHQLGVRMMHLTYNRRNMVGDGCAEKANGGLSDFGRAVVKEMNRVGVIVDMSHCGWQTSLEAAHASAQPMVASHSVACAVNEHIRGKHDDVIRAVCDTGGYIGICCIPGFLGGAGDIASLLDHIDHVVRTFGSEHVAIGTDCAYVSRNTAQETRKVPSRGSRRPRWEAFWPPNSLTSHLYPESSRLSLSWTNWPLFTVGMVQRGYSDEDIEQILGGNILRVARQAGLVGEHSW